MTVRRTRTGVQAVFEKGVELLTGVPAGRRDASGQFEEESVFARVDQRLREMADTLREYE